MAGACGNRTHPTRRGRVTIVLKTMKATRPHPPPERLRLCESDGVRAPADDFTDRRSTGNTRKIVVNFCGRERNEQTARGLRIDQQCPIDAARTAPLHVRFHVAAIALGTASGNAVCDRVPHSVKNRERRDVKP